MAAKDVSFLNKGSDVIISEYCCSSCEEGGYTIDAEFYCGQCVKFYCGECITPHRQLFKTHRVNGREGSARWPVPRATQDLLEKCDVHTDQKLELFCGDHDQLCCNTCVSLSHRQCCNVSLIPEGVKLKSSESIQKILSDIKIVIDQLMISQEMSKRYMQTLKASFEERLQEITMMRKKLNGALDKMEKTTLTEMGNIMTSLNTSFKSDMENCNKFRGEIKLVSDTMKNIGEKNTKLCFIARMKCRDKLKQSEAFLLEQDKKLKVESSLSFGANLDIERYLSKLQGLGKVATVQPNLRDTDQALAVKGTERFRLKMAGESRITFDIVGTCGLPNGEIVAVDRKNSKVLLLDSAYEIVSQCEMNTTPQDVCVMTDVEVAVTTTFNGCVHFVSVSKGRLVKGRKLQMTHECLGIVNHQYSLYVTSGTALYHYTLTGRLVNKLYNDINDRLTVLKCAVSRTGDKIYVTNNSQHKLLTLAIDGTVLSTFTDPELKAPTGVHVTSAGQVLVCGHKSNSIIQVDNKGKQRLAILASCEDGVLRPVSVFKDSATNSVVVSQWAPWQVLKLDL